MADSPVFRYKPDRRNLESRAILRQRVARSVDTFGAQTPATCAWRLGLSEDAGRRVLEELVSLRILERTERGDYFRAER